MDGGSETIRKFLVSLGFKVDENGMRKFEDGIKRATSAVVRFAAEVEATALTVAYGIDRWASGLEKLYFASQRTGASVTYLKALDRATQDMGLSAGEAIGQVEQLAAWLRKSPANEQMLANVIGPLKYLKNGLVDMDDAMKRVQGGMQRMVAAGGGKQFAAQYWASQLGFSDKFLQAILSGNFNSKISQSEHFLRNVNWDKAAKDSHNFESGLRDLGTVLESLGVEIEETLLKKLGVNYKDVGKWLQTHSHEIAEAVSSAILKIIEVGKWLISVFVDLDKYTDGWSTKLLALAAILKFTGAGSLIFGIGQMASAIAGVGVAAGIATVAVGALVAAGVAAGAHFANKEYHTKEYADERAKALAMPHSGSGATLGSVISSSMSNRQAATSFLQGLGLTNEQVAGVLGNLIYESGLNPGEDRQRGHYGIAQWDETRQRLFAKKFGHDIHGSRLDEQLIFLGWELENSEKFANSMLRKSGTPGEASDAFGKYFERYDPAGTMTKARETREQYATQVYQTLNFTINDAKDPEGVFDHIYKHLAEANARLRRNLTANAQ